MGRTVPVTLLQDLYCGIGCTEAGVVMEKDHFPIASQGISAKWHPSVFVVYLTMLSVAQTI
jgi:hypothetical protein